MSWRGVSVEDCAEADCLKSLCPLLPLNWRAQGSGFLLQRAVGKVSASLPRKKRLLSKEASLCEGYDNVPSSSPEQTYGSAPSAVMINSYLQVLS